LLSYVFTRALCPTCGLELRSELETALAADGWHWVPLCSSCGQNLKNEALRYCKELGITPACEACLGIDDE
jgi:hypothetical protein